jgi:Lrp/AsnC family transcriptional regulator for asnA, asnC and gidA
MPLKLDKTDALLLKELNRDGRLSYRQLSKIIGVSTPTIESHVSKLMGLGIISRFAPVLSIDKVERGTSALIFIRAELNKVSRIIDKLRELDEVRNIFVTSGEANIVIRVALPGEEHLNEFMESSLGTMEGIRVISSEMIIQTRKDEQGATFREGMAVSLSCDYCGKEITGEPVVLNVEGGRRYMCCTSCLSLYKAKYIDKRHLSY